MKFNFVNELNNVWNEKKGSLEVKLFIIVLTVLIFMSMAILCAASIVVKSSMDEQIEREAETLLSGVEKGINGGIDSVKSLSRSIMIDDQISYYLKVESVDPGIINDTRYSTMKILNAYSDIDSVIVIRNDGQYMNTCRDEYELLENYETGKWKEELDEKRGGALVCIDGNYTFHKKITNGNLSVARAIYDMNSQKQIGYLIINISENMLETATRQRYSKTVCIVSEKGDFLAGNKRLSGYYNSDDEEGIITEITDNNKQYDFMYKLKMPGVPLEIICSLEPAHMQIPATIIAVFAIIIIAFLISIFLFGYFIYKEIKNPIIQLISSMEETKNSGWLKSIDVQMTSNEFRRLSDSYNSLIKYLNDLIISVVEKEKIIQKAEMRVLHEQIKPHFLYNSLDTISFMALDEGAEDVHTAISTLGSFYRNFLSKGDRVIPLEREIRIVKDYLELQKLRYGDVITDEYEIDEDTYSCMLPKLLLQPLVENSIYHGIRPLGEPGIIRISSKLDDDKLKISVYDTGIGMTKERIKNLLSDKEKDNASVASGLSGFGLRGTIERVRFYCNNEDAILIVSEPGEYTQIDIYIPLLD